MELIGKPGLRARSPRVAKVVKMGLRGVLRRVPVRHRFALMVALARAAASLRKRGPHARADEPWYRDARVDAHLRQLMTRMMAWGVAFEPRIYLEGPPPPIPAREGRGMLCVGPRSSLHGFSVRYLHERGLHPVPVAAYDPYPVPGTTSAIPVLHTGPRLMFEVRRALREGRLVLAALGKETGQRVVRFDTARGEMDAGDALIRLALRCDADLCFAFAALDRDGAIAIRIETPQLGEHPTPERAVQAYVSAVQRWIAAG